MAASLMDLLDDLEARLERTQAELQALRDENQRLKQQLGEQSPSLQTTQAAPVADTPPEGASAENSAIEEASSEMADSQPAVSDTDVQKKVAAESPQAPKSPQAPESPQALGTEKPTVQTPSPNALLNTWYERYPNAFFKGHTKPLKVGIHQDLAEREQWPNKLIRRALANYVNLPRYIKAVRVGAERVDLDGNPAGKVDKESAHHASEKRSSQQDGTAPAKSDITAKQTKPHKHVKAKPVTGKSRPERGGQDQSEKLPEKAESHKPLSLEDKLIGLQQKFKGR